MKIYTLTLNPAYDVHAFAKSLALNCENLAEIESREAGGKGVTQITKLKKYDAYQREKKLLMQKGKKM